MPLLIPEELHVTKLKEAFKATQDSGEVSRKLFGDVLNHLKVDAKALDRLMLFDFIDEKNTGVINYMQFYQLIKENCEKYGLCSASDLVLNLSMEHSNSARGRKIRQDFKKRMMESDEPRKPPMRPKKSTSPRVKVQEEEDEPIPAQKNRSRRFSKEKALRSRRDRKRRVESTMDARRIGEQRKIAVRETRSLRSLADDNFENSRERLFDSSKPFSRKKSPSIQDDLMNFSMDDIHLGTSPRPYRNRRSISNPPSLFEIEEALQHQAQSFKREMHFENTFMSLFIN
jgi:hypothetical protein